MASVEEQKAKLKKDVESFKQNYIETIKGGHIEKLAALKNSDMSKTYSEITTEYDRLDDKVININKAADYGWAFVKNALKQFDMEVSFSSNQFGRDDYHLTSELSYKGNVVISNTVYSEYSDLPHTNNDIEKVLNTLSIEIENAKKNKDYIEYNKLVNKMNDLPLEKQSAQLAKINKYVAKNEIDAKKFDVYRELDPKMAELERQYKKALQDKKEWEEKVLKPAKNEREIFVETKKNKAIKELSEYGYNVLAMAYVKLYKDNFDILKYGRHNANETLYGTIGETEYYSSCYLKNIKNDFGRYEDNYDIASELHNIWREGRKHEDNTFEPRWKKVDDAELEELAENMSKLPSNLRIVDGKLEQDIANTEYNDLSQNYKIENFLAADVVRDVVSKHTYEKDEIGEAGYIIHEEWLKRNSWAKGSDLDVDFFDLSTEEKIKDLVQLLKAAETLKDKRADKELSMEDIR